MNTLGVLSGEAAGDRFFWVTPLGDINHDGFADFACGAQDNQAGGPYAGRCYIYLGSSLFDSVPDLVITGQANDIIGVSTFAAGDMNSDGYDDFVVGAVGANRAWLYFGSATPDAVPDLELNGGGAYYFGFLPRPLGDINADGHDDLVISAPRANRAYVFFGGPGLDGIADATFTGSGELGCQTAPGGDLNGDGYNDILIGAYKNGAGSASVYLGGPGFDTTEDFHFAGESYPDWFGSMDWVGDLNGDGFNDVVIGACKYPAGEDRGKVYIFFGGPVLDNIADVTMTGAAPGDAFGTYIGGIGDINHDGHVDLMVSALYNDDAGAHAGKVYIYFGGPGFDTTPDITMTGAATGDRYGTAVAGIGDINGDHVPEFAVGADQYENGGAGHVYVYELLGSAEAHCPLDLVIPWNSTIPSLTLAGFHIKNTSTTAQSFHYTVTSTGPAPLVDKGNPAALEGDTPMIPPFATWYAPEAGLQIPRIDEPAGPVRQYVTYHVVAQGDPTCTTVITFEPPIPVLISSFAGTPVEGGVTLDWKLESDETITGIAIYRALGDEPLGRNITPALLPPATRSYSDRNLAAATTYRYALGVILAGGSEMRSPIVMVKTRPYVLALDQNIPNPFNPRTTIAFTLPSAANVTLAVYTVEGRLVKTLLSTTVGEGPHKYVWDGTDASGASVSSGVYFSRLTAGKHTLTRKMILLK